MSGFQRRKLREAAGLPRYTPAEAASRRASDIRRTVERRRRAAAHLSAYKLERGCSDCGFKGHPAALEFDHLPGSGKVANVNRLLSQAHSLTKIMDEVAKCEVVCANCHRVRTADRYELSQNQEKEASGHD